MSLAFCFGMAYVAEAYFGIADITGAYIAGIVLCTMNDALLCGAPGGYQQLYHLCTYLLCLHRP